MTIQHHRFYVALTIALAMLVAQACSQSAGIQAYSEGDYGTAARIFGEKVSRDGETATLNNFGAAVYKLDQYPLALTAFSLAASHATDPQQRGDSMYNAGNAAYKAGDLMRAIGMYRAALKERDDQDTRVNLEIAKRKLQERMQKSQQQRSMQKQQLQQQDSSKTDDSQQQEDNQNKDQQKQQESSDPSPTSGEPSPKTEEQGKTDAQQQDADQDKQAESDGQKAQNQEESDGENTSEAKEDGKAGKVDPDQDPKSDKNKKGNNVLLRKRLDQLQEGNPIRYGNAGGIGGKKPW